MSPLARQLVDFLRTRPPQSAREACAFLGVSQPVFSRLVASLGTQVLTLGKARRTRYAARREIPGVGDRCVLYEIDAAGSSRRAATLHAVGAGGFVVESEVAEIQSAHFQDLPYFLDGMRPAGFLGRRVPKQQRSNKEAKKPKKDVAPKPASPGSLAAPITTVVPERGKKKK